MRALAAALLALFVALNAAWLAQDRLVRDGDEEGHVGAAELFAWDLGSQRPGAFLQRALWEDMGDYPSAWPAVVGAWWHVLGGGDPGRPTVRAVSSATLLVTGMAVTVAAWDSGAAALLAGASVLFLPLLAGLGRHFMPEGALAAAVALAVAAAVHQRRRPTPGRAVLLGLALALGMLTKQTFPLYAAVPVALAVRWKPSLAWLALGALLAGPWYGHNLAEQLSYGTASAEYQGGASFWDHLLYYPLALVTLALGPVWSVALAAAAWSARDSRHRHLARLGLAWLFGGMALLTLVPKKYDRLLAPLLPGAGLVLAAGLAARPRGALLALGGVAWTCWLSFSDDAPHTPPAPLVDFEPGCLQVWLRPPQVLDLGFDAVAAQAETVPYGGVLVLAPPEIPCAVQTTFGWAYHLGPHLRRAGLERPIHVDEADGPVTLTIDFREGVDGEVLAVPLLGLEARIRRSDSPAPAR